MNRYIFAAALAAAAISGCSERGPEEVPGTGQELPVKLITKGTDSGINDVRGYRFHGGILQEICIPRRTSGDIRTFSLSSREGTLYILANAGELEGLGDMTPGKTSLAGFLETGSSVESMTSSGITMSGRTDISSATGQPADVEMTRSVARLDFVVREKGVKVLSARITGLSDRGFVNTREKPGNPEGASVSEFVKDFRQAPAEYTRETLTYMAEQTGSVTAEVTAEFGGGRHVHRAELPREIARNTVYTLNIYGKGAEISSQAFSEDWEEGGSTGSWPVIKGLVDTENSVLSEGSTVSQGRDTVYISYLGSSLELAVLAAPGARVETDGTADGVSVRVSPSSRTGLEQAAIVHVDSGLRLPGKAEERINVDIYEEDIHSGRIVLIFTPNPVLLEGKLTLDGSGTCDFDRYIDGELGTVTVPSGRTLRLEFGEGEDPWMQALETGRAGTDGESRTYRITGGWKPNDPKADGRIQEGRIVISGPDGSGQESYTIRRRNWGLPVVKIGQTWWCKYNLRGNVKEFNDQITCNIDPAADDKVAEMLATETESVLLELMGDQYQGGNPDGLPLRHDGSAFYYEGMKASAQNFGTLDPESMAPDGYRIPDYEDYAFFSASDNYNIGGTGTRTFRNTSGEELTVTVTERQVDFLWNRYGTIAFYDFEYEGSHWVLYGLGHQWSTAAGDIARMNLLLATHSGNGNSWNMEGYAMSDRPGQNWMKFTAHNSTKTRTIRCVKTPVEYIY